MRAALRSTIVGFEETFVSEVVDLNAREGEGELVLFIVAGEVGVGQQLRRAPPIRSRFSRPPGALPDRRWSGGDDKRRAIAALGLGDVREIRFQASG